MTTCIYSQADIHGARSFGYGLIAQAFRCPTSAALHELRNPARWQAWQKILREVYPKTAEPLAKLAQLILSPGPLEHLEHEYVSLFGHTVRGSCPLYELEYGQSEIIQQASVLADIAGFYSAFGLVPTVQLQERQDHLSVESEFMSIVAAQEAYAFEKNHKEAHETVREAQAAFLRDHLGRWAPTCMRRIRQATRNQFYGATAEFAAYFIAAECDSLNVGIGPELLDLREVDPSTDANIDCGVEESCPGSRDHELVQIHFDAGLRGRGE